MKNRILNAFAMIAAGLLIAGCASAPKAEKYSDLPQAGKLQPDPRFPHSQVFIKEGVAFGQYSRFMIDPVEIFRGSGATWKGISEETKQEIARFLRDEFVRVLQSYGIVDKPAAGVLRIKFTLVDMQLTKPLLAAVTHLAPAGFAMNLGKGAAGAKGSFMGSVIYSGELRDALSGDLVAAFLTTQAPNAMDFTTMVTPTDAVRKAITESAEKFKLHMDRAHGIAPPAK